MRSYSLFIGLALLVGCSSGQSWPSGGAGDEATEAPGGSVAEIKQKSQFADANIINLVDPGVATLALTADGNPVTVQIFYTADKTTDTGRTSANPVLVDTVTLAVDQTKRHNVNLNHAAFQGGYGSIFLDAIGINPSDVFQTYVEYGGSIFSTGGSTFQGGSYRIPYLTGTLRVVLVLTNQSGFPFDVTLSNLGKNDIVHITQLAPLSTYKFDSFAKGWDLSGTSSIQLITTDGGTVSLSGYVDRLLQRQRISPVKAAPFF